MLRSITSARARTARSCNGCPTTALARWAAFAFLTLLCVLTGASGARAGNVGYYEMCNGQGMSWQVPPITTAGQTPVPLFDLGPSDLAGLDVVFVTNCNNGAYGSEYLSRLSDVQAAVSGGLVLVIHDRHVDGAESILPGGGGFTIVRSFTDAAQVDVLDATTLVTDGPGGIVGNATLDGGTHSTHGYAAAGSLPGAARTILSRTHPGEVVTFSYAYGSGSVVYSTIPLDFYLELSTYRPNFNLVYAPNVVAYAAALAVRCGDGVLEGGEACDDGNGASGDGCSAACAIETGWSCSGAPSACAPICGDGAIHGTEECDDGNAAAGDGCSEICSVETGWSCSGAPSACGAICGDGTVTGAESCDDANVVAGDGCSDTCSVETGWSCVGAPSSCSAICGDGLVTGSESCDDGNTADGDGCTSACILESGYHCSGSPSFCMAICGDGLLVTPEACDDANVANGDGCSATCGIETGWACGGAPSSCSPICGDGTIAGSEACDDSNTTGGDGCSGTCNVEIGWACAGAPSVCSAVCGDGLVLGGESCDDGAANGTLASCCSATCSTRPNGTLCDSGLDTCSQLDTCSSGSCLNVGGGGDGDSDQVCDLDDNCPTTANASQSDIDSDLDGDACDASDAPGSLVVSSARLRTASGSRLDGSAAVTGILNTTLDAAPGFEAEAIGGTLSVSIADGGAFRLDTPIVGCVNRARTTAFRTRIVCVSPDRNVRVTFSRTVPGPVLYRTQINIAKLASTVTGTAVPVGPVDVRIHQEAAGIDRHDAIGDHAPSCTARPRTISCKEK
jgi:cysteine-rich repeat protein